MTLTNCLWIMLFFLEIKCHVWEMARMTCCRPRTLSGILWLIYFSQAAMSLWPKVRHATTPSSSLAGHVAKRVIQLLPGFHVSLIRLHKHPPQQRCMQPALLCGAAAGCRLQQGQRMLSACVTGRKADRKLVIHAYKLWGWLCGAGYIKFKIDSFTKLCVW